MKYNIGDKVRIRNNLITGEKYDEGCTFMGSMEKFRGEIVTIALISGTTYKIEEDENYGYWYWSEDMIEYKVEEKVTECKVEDEKEIESDKKEAIVTTFTYLEGIQYFTELNSATGKTALYSYDILEKTEKIIQSGNVTIVIMDDGTKGVSKCDPDDKYDAEEGIKIARARARIKALKKELKQLLQ